MLNVCKNKYYIKIWHKFIQTNKKFDLPFLYKFESFLIALYVIIFTVYYLLQTTQYTPRLAYAAMPVMPLVWSLSFI